MGGPSKSEKKNWVLGPPVRRRVVAGRHGVGDMRRHSEEDHRLSRLLWDARYLSTALGLC